VVYDKKSCDSLAGRCIFGYLAAAIRYLRRNSYFPLKGKKDGCTEEKSFEGATKHAALARFSEAAGLC